MRKTLQLKIDSQQNGLAVKAVLSANGLSRREISRLKFSGGILLNGRQCRVTEPVQTGDLLELTFMEQDTAKAIRIKGKPDILYEDEDLVIVNKPSGMPCHPSHEHLDDDMGTLLQEYYGGGFTIRPIGRLDKDVSGIMLYAKNQPAAARLSRQHTEGILKKEYLAIAQGHFTKAKDQLTYRLKKEQGRKDRVLSEGGQLCVTDYEVIQEVKGNTLIKVIIHTGRTHQIRAGMASIGHPLLGDKLYGGDITGIRRPALHCAFIQFKQPFTGADVQLELPLPDDLQELLKETENV